MLVKQKAATAAERIKGWLGIVLSQGRGSLL
jgi:hypothetical protein